MVERLDLDTAAATTDGGSAGIGLIVGLIRGGLSGVKAPPGPEGLLNLLGSGELQVADLLGDDGALMLRLQAGDQLGLQTAGLLGVQVAHLLRDINEGSDGLVMALLGALLGGAAGTTDLDGKLLTASIANKLARLLLNITSGTRGLIHGLTDIRALAIAHLNKGPVALLHILFDSLLLESDLTALLKILLTHFLLSRVELCDIGVVALLNILVGTLKDGILLQGGYSFFLLHTAEASVGVSLAAAEVDASTADVLLPGAPLPLHNVGRGRGHKAQSNEELEKGARM